MSDEIKVLKGTKITAEEAAKLDRSKMLVATGAPQEEKEVEGQWWHRAWAHCPWCGHVGYVVFNEQWRHEHWVTCGHCGNGYRTWG